MTYQNFCELLQDAAEIQDFDLFAAECGGSVPEDVPDDKVLPLLQAIHDAAHGSVKALRSLTGLSQSRFALRYSVPVRNLQQWENGARTPLEYVVCMLAYIVIGEVVLS